MVVCKHGLCPCTLKLSNTAAMRKFHTREQSERKQLLFTSPESCPKTLWFQPGTRCSQRCTLRSISYIRKWHVQVAAAVSSQGNKNFDFDPAAGEGSLVATLKAAGTAIVESIHHGKRTQTPPLPFTTARLQQDAARYLGFSVKQTMATAQRLFERAPSHHQHCAGQQYSAPFASVQRWQGPWLCTCSDRLPSG